MDDMSKKGETVKIQALLIGLLVLTAGIIYSAEVSRRQEAGPINLSAFEQLPQLVQEEIARNLSDKELAHLAETSKTEANYFIQELERRGRLIKYWSTGTIVSDVLQKYTDMTVESEAFSPNGELLALGFRDATIRIWNLREGREIKVLPVHASANSLAFSPDSKQIAAGFMGSDKNIVLFDIETGKESKVFKGHTDSVSCVAFSFDGKKLASGSHDKTVRIWDVETGKESEVLIGHTDIVLSLAFSPDGKKLASGSGSFNDQTIRLWDVQTGVGTGELQWAGVISSLAFSSDGKLLGSGSTGPLVILWDVQTGKPINEPSKMASSKGRWALVMSVALSPDSKLSASGCIDGTIKLHDVKTGTEIRILTGHTGAVRLVKFSPDGKLLVSGSDDTTFRLWKVVHEPATGVGWYLNYLMKFLHIR